MGGPRSLRLDPRDLETTRAAASAFRLPAVPLFASGIQGMTAAGSVDAAAFRRLVDQVLGHGAELGLRAGGDPGEVEKAWSRSIP
jgi:hypothetical protein